MSRYILAHATWLRAGRSCEYFSSMAKSPCTNISKSVPGQKKIRIEVFIHCFLFVLSFFVFISFGENQHE